MMLEEIARLFKRYLNISEEWTFKVLRHLGVAFAATLFVLIATVLVAFDDVFPGQTSLTSLQVGDIAPRDIHAPEAPPYLSEILTAQRKKIASDSISPVYDPPDPNVARQQTQLARQILDFIENVRRDPFGTTEQKNRDINQITALTLDPAIIDHMLEMSEETWKEVDDQIVSVLERVMRESIRESDLHTVLDQLPTQVSVRFGTHETEVIVAVIEDLIRPNRFENPVATEDARKAAAAAVEAVERNFERGQIVVREGERIDEAAYEALTKLGLLKPEDRRAQEVGRALLASIIVMVVIGLYVVRFKPQLVYEDTRFLTLLATLFLIALMGARFLGVNGQIYLYPTAALPLLYVTLIGPEIAIIGSLGLSLLVSLMAGNSLEIASLITVSGLIGTLTIRRAERLNSYFFAGLMIAVANMAIVGIFNLGGLSVSSSDEFTSLIVYSLLNGLLAAAAAFAGMYMVTLLFNLPTSLKLIELSQPNQPLLQRLLREAPGTYQHSLQVGNLCEQAANAIGANASLIHVAALYHDIGKMLNPVFFTENQHDIGNPHDAINDPYRSANIIISHVTEGDELAKQYRLPNRIRDFIREHHGTTLVWVFYRQAVDRAGGDESAVDINEFAYPGPRPQTRETAIMMLADSCEATVRARQPKNRQEIADAVHDIVEDKRRSGQLDESGLTLNDLKTIQNIFIEMLQAVFHPRINYPALASKMPKTESVPKPPPPSRTDLKRVSQEVRTIPAEENRKPDTAETVTATSTEAPAKGALPNNNHNKAVLLEDDDDSPLPDVPPLPRTGEFRAVNTNDRGKTESSDKQPKIEE